MDRKKYKYLYGNQYEDGGEMSEAPSGGGSGGFNAMSIAGAVGSLGPELISSISQYNAPISDNAQLLGKGYVDRKRKFNKTTGILGALGLNLFNSIDKDLTNLEDEAAGIVKSMEAPERADNLDEAMNNAAAFKKQEYSFDNPYGEGTGFGNFLRSTGQGAIAGTQILPGWGTLGGATVGTLNFLINNGRNRDMYNAAASAARSAIRKKEKFIESSIQNNISSLNTKNMRSQMAQMAYGGPLGISLTPVNGAIDYMQNEELLSTLGETMTQDNNRRTSMPILAFGGALGGYGGDWSNGLNFIKAGGTHGENPIGGVPMGIAQDGMPNLVEEGEVVWNDYVFSNRINVPKETMERLGINGKDTMTFAEAVEKAQKSSAERPNDPIEKRSLDAVLAGLMQEQEEIRQRKAEKEQFDNMEEAAAFAADGGPIHIAKNKKGTFTAAATKHGMGVQEFAGHVLANKDKYSPAMVKKANFARNASKWNHAMGGHLFPLGGHFDPNTGMWIPEETIPSFKVDNTYKAPEYQFGEANPDFSVPETNQAFRFNQFWQPPMKLNFESGVTPSRGDQETPTTTTTTSLPTSGWQTSLRYAPILGPAIGLAHTLFNKPDYEYANELEAAAEQYAGRAHHVAPTMLGDYLAYNPFDRLFYANELGAQQAATRRAIMNSSNGNAGQAMAALLAAGYNDNIGLGKLFREGEEYNLGQRQKVSEFNRGTNQFNAEADLKSQMFNAEQDRAIAAMLLGAKERSLAMKQADDQAYQTALMANLSGLFDNLGALGEDYANKYDRNMLINSGVFGTLSQKPQGVSDKDWEAYLRVVGRPYAKGGKMNKRKKGLTI